MKYNWKDKNVSLARCLMYVYDAPSVSLQLMQHNRRTGGNCVQTHGNLYMQHKQQLCATSTAIHPFDTSRSLFQEYLYTLEKALLSLTRQHERQRTGKL
mmetsp:Transcript_3072/g.5669  ORF Transcript_3072/g.5669 Transcript_3072/m.5669 type:complete len:99 (-) Transcript_3072:1006-1302(-)